MRGALRDIACALDDTFKKRIPKAEVTKLAKQLNSFGSISGLATKPSGLIALFHAARIEVDGCSSLANDDLLWIEFTDRPPVDQEYAHHFGISKFPLPLLHFASVEPSR